MMADLSDQPLITIDGRGLEPPEPLELTLEALDSLQPGRHILLLVNCEPHPLYAILRRNHYQFSSGFDEAGTNHVRIWKD